MLSLKTLFRSEPASRDGLTQPQREAIVDLLNYCAFVDHDIADSEEATINELEVQLDWDHKTDFDYYVNKSIGVVRSALESKDEPYFLEQIAARLDSRKSRETAVSLCEKLMKSDDRVPPEESATLAAVKKALD
jgi:hypothetical protein